MRFSGSPSRFFSFDLSCAILPLTSSASTARRIRSLMSAVIVAALETASRTRVTRVDPRVTRVDPRGTRVDPRTRKTDDFDGRMAERVSTPVR